MADSGRDVPDHQAATPQADTRLADTQLGAAQTIHTAAAVPAGRPAQARGPDRRPESAAEAMPGLSHSFC